MLVRCSIVLLVSMGCAKMSLITSTFCSIYIYGTLKKLHLQISHMTAFSQQKLEFKSVDS